MEDVTLTQSVAGERRRSSDTQIGYLTGKVEEIGELLGKVDERLDGLEKRVDEKFTTVETALKAAKFVGLIVAALVTLKWGSIPDLWHLFFG